MLYAVGDIHGMRVQLEKLMRSLPLQEDDHVVFIGDYVDRGPDPAGTVDFLVEFKKSHRCTFLIGNHESMFLDFIGWEGPMYFAGDAFLMNGGDRTLVSYDYFDSDLEPTDFKVPKDHEDFYRNLELHYMEGDYLFVHAGLSRAALDSSSVDVALRRSDAEDMLWNRTSADLPHKLGVTVVYGHTPAHDLQVRWNPPFSIGIDTGAVYGGKLTAIRLPDETIFQV